MVAVLARRGNPFVCVEFARRAVFARIKNGAGLELARWTGVAAIVLDVLASDIVVAECASTAVVALVVVLKCAGGARVARIYRALAQPPTPANIILDISRTDFACLAGSANISAERGGKDDRARLHGGWCDVKVTGSSSTQAVESGR